MTLRSARLSFRIQRFESTMVVGAAILSVLVSAAVIALYGAGGYSRCEFDESIQLTSFCQASIGVWLNRIARLSLSIVPVFPVVAGLLAGGPIVAREIETGTARLAWSLAPSRLRWFGQRVVPILTMVFVASLAIGLTADALTHLLRPSVDLDASFAGFRGRGLLIGVEGVLVASIALAFGAILGRSVPTFVLSLVLAFAIGIVVDKVEREVITSEALIGGESSFDEQNLWLDSRLQMPDGSILTWEQFGVQYPDLAQNGWDESSGIRNVNLYIPGSRYHDLERREALALLLVSAAFVALAAITVVRRRPR